MDLVRVEEGSTRFFVPRQDTSSRFPPGTARVFYNRRMELNRDATVLFTSVMKPSGYLDAMGATGIRGLRIASECGVPVTINDHDPDACNLIRKNVAESGMDIEVTCRNVHALLAERRFDAVDLDPYGSPAPFIDSGIRGVRSCLMVTATDTAPLCGAHKRAGIRRYFAQPLNTEYHAETGLRILLAFVAREIVKYDRGLDPLFCFAREHYIRAHFRITQGASAADRTIGRIGYVHQCPRCPERVEQAGILPEPIPCARCGIRMVPIGPLWLGHIQEPAVISLMLNSIASLKIHTTRELSLLLELLSGELPLSCHYDYHRIAKHAKVSPRPIRDVIASLQAEGYAAGRAHYSGTALKTDAPLSALISVLERADSP